MRRSLLFSSLLVGTVFTTSLAQSQADRFAYAITDIQKEGANWAYLRKLDLKTGMFTDVLLNGMEQKQMAFDAISRKEITTFSKEVNRGYSLRPAFSSGVAAMAFDKRNNRIWYTPMFIDELRFVDLKTMQVYYMASRPFTGMAKKSADQGNIITRMTIADDGYGYALTNDGAHLMRFSTGKEIEITDLGRVADNPENETVSIHSSCSSFGGDMIADNSGNLYVISAYNYVFRINIETKVATYLGRISGFLDPKFTTNGAVVTPDNKILLGSSLNATDYYIVDNKSWTATPYKLAEVWRNADLANSNLLDTKPKTPSAELASRIIPNALDNDTKLVQVYPNPVTNDQFAIQFANLEAGEYNIRVTDVMGRQVVQRIVTVSSDDQTETIRLDRGAARGFYLINILDKDNKSVYSKKLIVQ